MSGHTRGALAVALASSAHAGGQGCVDPRRAGQQPKPALGCETTSAHPISDNCYRGQWRSPAHLAGRTARPTRRPADLLRSPPSAATTAGHWAGGAKDRIWPSATAHRPLLGRRWCDGLACVGSWVPPVARAAVGGRWWCDGLACVGCRVPPVARAAVLGRWWCDRLACVGCWVPPVARAAVLGRWWCDRLACVGSRVPPVARAAVGRLRRAHASRHRCHVRHRR
jgi:hypothetical protein